MQWKSNNKTSHKKEPEWNVLPHLESLFIRMQRADSEVHEEAQCAGPAGLLYTSASYMKHKSPLIARLLQPSQNKDTQKRCSEAEVLINGLLMSVQIIWSVIEKNMQESFLRRCVFSVGVQLQEGENTNS